MNKINVHNESWVVLVEDRPFFLMIAVQHNYKLEQREGMRNKNINTTIARTSV
jgi:hypothetical protein